MRILGACIFLSFLAGKLKIFKQNLFIASTVKILKKTARAYFGGKIKKNLSRVCQKYFTVE